MNAALIGNFANNNGEDGYHFEGAGPANVLTQNTASNNGEDGFDMQMPGAQLRNNIARANARDGFRIRADADPITRNHASGNTDEDLDVGGGATVQNCNRNIFTTTNGQCPPQFP